jgi:hypothetical protein
VPRNIYLDFEVTYHLEDQLLMTATTAEYASDQRKGIFCNIADSIRLALKLKDQFERIDDPQKRQEAVRKIISGQ